MSFRTKPAPAGASSSSSSSSLSSSPSSQPLATGLDLRGDAEKCGRIEKDDVIIAVNGISVVGERLRGRVNTSHERSRPRAEVPRTSLVEIRVLVLVV